MLPVILFWSGKNVPPLAAASPWHCGNVAGAGIVLLTVEG